MQNNSIFRPSPDSPRNWPANAFPLLPSIAAAIGGLFVYFLTLMVLVRAFHVTSQSLRALELTPSIVEAQVVGYVPIMIYVAAVLPLLARRPLGEILGRLGSSQIVAGLTGAVAMWMAVMLVGAVQTVFVGHAPTQTAVRLFENTRPGVWLDLMAAIAVTLAPFAEELVFRGFIFNALWKRFSFPGAAIISGIIFGAAHGQTAGIAPLAAGGVVLATVYARTGSLWASMIAHGTFNSITLALLLLAGIKT